MLNQEEQGKKMGQLIAKCWADEGFKRKLLADPAATLKAEGAELPAGLSIKALADDDKVGSALRERATYSSSPRSRGKRTATSTTGEVTTGSFTTRARARSVTSG